jgi:hypothetical protein
VFPLLASLPSEDVRDRGSRRCDSRSQPRPLRFRNLILTADNQRDPHHVAELRFVSVPTNSRAGPIFDNADLLELLWRTPGERSDSWPHRVKKRWRLFGLIDSSTSVVIAKSERYYPTALLPKAAPASSLINAVARAYLWYERIRAGEVQTIRELARDSRETTSYVTRILQCAFLSPQIVESVLSGKHRPNLVVTHLLELPIDWPTQNHMVSRG